MRRRTRAEALAPCMAGLLGLCVPGASLAQDAGPVDAAISVQKRPRPDLDAVPVRLGSLELLPTVDLRASYDDNIYASATGKVDDALSTLGLGISARSTWSRHALSFDADAAITRGLSQRDEDVETWNTRLGGRLDLGTGTQLSAHLGYARAYEPRGSIGDTTLRGPRIAYDMVSAGAEFRHQAARLLVQGEATLDRFQYAPYRTAGAQVSQRERDYRTWSALLRAGYAVGPGIAAIVEGGWNAARYPGDGAALDRSSQGWSARAGVQFGLTRLIRGRAALGYQNQRYADPAFPRIKGLDFGASLEWNPTRLMTWTLEARRTIQRSPLVGVAGIRQSRYAARLDYELRRNLVVSPRIEHTVSDYAGTPRVQRDWSGGVEAVWLVNRNMRMTASAGWQGTRSDGAGGRDFDRRRVSLSLRYAL